MCAQESSSAAHQSIPRVYYTNKKDLHAVPTLRIGEYQVATSHPAIALVFFVTSCTPAPHTHSNKVHTLHCQHGHLKARFFMTTLTTLYHCYLSASGILIRTRANSTIPTRTTCRVMSLHLSSEKVAQRANQKVVLCECVVFVCMVCRCKRGQRTVYESTVTLFSSVVVVSSSSSSTSPLPSSSFVVDILAVTRHSPHFSPYLSLSLSLAKSKFQTFSGGPVRCM